MRNPRGKVCNLRQNNFFLFSHSRNILLFLNWNINKELNYRVDEYMRLHLWQKN